LLELFDYNAWANRLILDAAGGLPAEHYFRDLKSSFGGVHGTLCHMVWVEQVWLHRWMVRPNPEVAQGKDLTSLAQVRARWEAVEAERAAYIAPFTAGRLEETRLVKPSSGGEYVHTFRQMFRHFINHSSYHRGQIVTFLRQLGHAAPSTDLILYYRQKGAVR
jgi:uncharacterized damage-inducible protein DinB